MKDTDIHVRDERKPGHFWADNEVYDVLAQRVGVYGFAVYMALCRYSNKQATCNPSYEELAKKLGVSRRTVIRAINRLETEKLIKIKPVYKTVRGKRRNSANVYTILSVKLRKDLGEIPSDCESLGGASVSPPSDSGDLDLVTEGHPNKTQEQQDTVNKLCADAPRETTVTPICSFMSQRQSDPYAPPSFTADFAKDVPLQGAQVIEKGKPKGHSDPRTAHPAIQAMHAVTNRFPPKEMYDRIIQSLGDKPDVDRLRECRVAWLGRGYNPNALTWALEWYGRGVTEQHHAGANGRRTDEPAGFEAIRQAMQDPRWNNG